MFAGSVLELILFSIPSLIYRRMLRRRGQARSVASAAVGLVHAARRHYLAAAGVLTVTAVLGLGALMLIPATELSRHGVEVGHPTTIAGYASIVLLALGEEMLFRGYLAGLLFRRLGFATGNAIQALIFLTPHVLLLLVSATLWPILPVQLAAGWLLGWLRYRSGSVWPASLAHALANLLAALAV